MQHVFVIQKASSPLVSLPLALSLSLLSSSTFILITPRPDGLDSRSFSFLDHSFGRPILHCQFTSTSCVILFLFFSFWKPIPSHPLYIVSSLADRAICLLFLSSSPQEPCCGLWTAVSTLDALPPSAWSS